MLSVFTQCLYAGCPYDEGLYSECLHAECSYTECRVLYLYAESVNTKCRKVAYLSTV